MNKKLLYNFFYFMVILFTFTACVGETYDVNDINDIEVTTSLAIPIADINGSVTDFLKNYNDTVVIQDQDTREIYMVWENTTLAIDNTLMNEVSYTNSTPLSNNIILSETDELKPYFLFSNEVTLDKTDTFNITQDTEYDLGFQANDEKNENFRIDSVFIANMDVTVDISTLDLTIPDAAPLVITLTIPEISSMTPMVMNFTGSSKSQTFHLKDITIALPKSTSIIESHLNILLTSDGTTKIKKSSQFSYTLSFAHLKPDLIYGKAQRDKDFSSDLITMDIPSDFFEFYEGLDATLYFSDPAFIFKVTSNAGLPLRLTFSNILATDGSTDTVYADFDGSLKKDLLLPKPNNVGDTIVYNEVFNRDNGNTNKLFTLIPRTISYEWSLGAYDNGATGTDTVDYVINPNLLSLQTSCKIPFKLDAQSHFSIQDTIDFNMDETFNIEDIGGDINPTILHLFLDVDNSMPFSVTGRVHFLDENYDKLFTAQDSIFLLSAKVDAEGKVTESSHSLTQVTIDETDAEEVLDTKYLTIEWTISGYDATSRMHLFMDDNFTGKLSAYLKLKYETSIND